MNNLIGFNDKLSCLERRLLNQNVILRQKLISQFSKKKSSNLYSII